MKFIELTRDDGPALYVSVPPGYVVTTPPANSPEWAKGRIITQGIAQDVNETVEDLLQLFETIDASG